jgi:hypothetical protein
MEGGRIVIVKGKAFYTIVEFRDIISPLAAQIVDFVTIFVLKFEKSKDLFERIPVHTFH